jgi:hypothetical protein
MKNSAVDYLSDSLKVNSQDSYLGTLTIPNTNADQSSQLMKQEILKNTLITAGKYIYIQFNHADLRREKREVCTVEPWIASIIRSRNVLVIQNTRISK